MGGCQGCSLRKKLAYFLISFENRKQENMEGIVGDVVGVPPMPEHQPTKKV